MSLLYMMRCQYAGATQGTAERPRVVSVAWDIVKREAPSVQMTREIYGRTAAGALAGGKGPMGDTTGGDVHLKGGDGGMQKLRLLGIGPGVHLGRQRANGLLGIA